MMSLFLSNERSNSPDFLLSLSSVSFPPPLPRTTQSPSFHPWCVCMCGGGVTPLIFVLTKKTHTTRDSPPGWLMTSAKPSILILMAAAAITPSAFQLLLCFPLNNSPSFSLSCSSSSTLLFPPSAISLPRARNFSSLSLSLAPHPLHISQKTRNHRSRTVACTHSCVAFQKRDRYIPLQSVQSEEGSQTCQEHHSTLFRGLPLAAANRHAYVASPKHENIDGRWGEA